jgi:hypothetical protein
MNLRTLTLLSLCGWQIAIAADPPPAPSPAPTQAAVAAGTKQDAKPAAEPVIDPAAVTYEDLPPDRGVEVPWAETPATAESDPFVAEEVASFKRTLETWRPASDPNIDRRVQACLSLAALADSCRAAYESEAPVVLFDHLRATVPTELLEKALARVALAPATMTITDKIDAFSLGNDDHDDLRWRMVGYAKKMLGRLLHKLP